MKKERDGYSSYVNKGGGGEEPCGGSRWFREKSERILKEATRGTNVNIKFPTKKNQNRNRCVYFLSYQQMYAEHLLCALQFLSPLHELAVSVLARIL